ncbi:outer membrane receptor for ferrienterochelin and colicin [Sphingomonas zeicaulis]|uniref:TonB-dependent receptor domain-containing protein n=1 Tax=Sphingomonas zeicaulis TaxID=1632740 RepID=UPI003D1BD398
MFNATETLTIKGGITSGYKVPSLRLAATVFGSTSMGRVIIGNPALKPEKTLNYEAGVSYVNRDAGISTSLTAYNSEFEDKLLRTGRICAQNTMCEHNGVTYPTHQFGYATYENVDSVKLKGVAWTVEWKITDALRYRHGSTYPETEQTSGVNADKPLHDIPEHVFNASLDWDVSEPVKL